MKPKLLLFDIDGTLLSTAGAGLRAMDRVAARLFGKSFNFDQIHVGGMLDPLIFAEAAARNGLEDHEAHHETFREHYVAELRAVLADDGAETKPMPGIRAVLEQLRQRRGGGIILGLLSGNYAAAAPMKLAAAGLDLRWFAITCFGDEGPSRPDLVALALRRYHHHTGQPADPAAVIVIGDTPNDVQCAKAHGCICFAVATGPYSPDELRRSGADVVVENLRDPAPLFDLIDSDTSSGQS